MGFSRAMEKLQRPQIKVKEIFYYKAQKTKLENMDFLRRERGGHQHKVEQSGLFICGLKLRFI